MKKDRKDDSGITPAALSALAAGDLANFFVAATPGGIEAQEAAGQEALATAFDRLPIRGTLDPNMKPQWEAVGFTFDESKPFEDRKDARIFVRCHWPTGWKLQPTDHSMWSSVLDANGHKRARVFFKAAFYDYNAHTFGLESRYSVGSDYVNLDDYQDSRKIYYVIDNQTSQRLYEAQGDVQTARAEVEAWLAINYPDYKDPLKYWN